MKTLIAEDNPVSAMYFQKILSVFGECDVTVDGNGAIQSFTKALKENEPYDLICLDIMMPDIEGHQALKKIRQAEKDSGIKCSDEVTIIMLTGVDDPKIMVETLNEGATAYLVKPIRKEELKKEVHSLGLISENQMT